MKAGLYVVNFTSNLGNFGGGVVFVENGRIHGGDFGYLYFGKYQTNGNFLSGQVIVKRYNAQAVSIVGNLNEFSLTINGNVVADGFNSKSLFNGQEVNIVGKWIADPVQ